MVDLDEDFAPLPVDGIDQLFEEGGLVIPVDQGHARRGLSLIQDTGVLEVEIPDPPVNSFNIIGNVAVINLAFRAGKVGGHGGHDDPILQFQFPDPERAEKGFKWGHCITSIWDFRLSEHITGDRGRAIHELPMGGKSVGRVIIGNAFS
jgi:hypothetical protein